MSFVDHTYNEYIDAYRVNFANWKIVDIDNFMDGNHFFSELKEEAVWQKKVADTLISTKAKVWREKEAKETMFDRDILIPTLNSMKIDIEKIDTKSNRLMNPFYKRKE